MLLEPAVTAFRTVGVPASLDDELEICVGDRKICGHGAGQIGQQQLFIIGEAVRFP